MGFTALACNIDNAAQEGRESFRRHLRRRERTIELYIRAGILAIIGSLENVWVSTARVLNNFFRFRCPPCLCHRLGCRWGIGRRLNVIVLIICLDPASRRSGLLMRLGVLN
jgi:hypothetical protein